MSTSNMYHSYTELSRIDSKQNMELMHVEHSKQLRTLAYDIVEMYAEYDKYDQSYTIYIDQIPDMSLFELSAMIMQEDSIYALEATGPDNNQYQSLMLPAMTKYLTDITDKDNEVEFLRTWNAGITLYLNKVIEDLIYSALEIYNNNKSYEESDEWVA